MTTRSPKTLNARLLAAARKGFDTVEITINPIGDRRRRFLAEVRDLNDVVLGQYAATPNGAMDFALSMLEAKSK